MSILSDEDFLKLDRDRVFEEIEKQTNEYEQSTYQNQQEEVPQDNTYQNSYETTNTVPTQEQSNQYEAQMNYGVEDQNNTTTSDTPDNAQQIDPAIYEDAYKKMTSPFKASGREFQVRNVDEAISLMQKGVDYTRKQQALKPRLMEMRTLESQNMLGSNLNYAIDLFNGKPEAIAKLIKDKNIDVNSLVPQSRVDDFGNEVKVEDKPYTPTEYGISASKYEFMEVVDELKNTNMFDKVANAIDRMDNSSREKFTNDPKKLLALSNHISSGLYDQILSELDHARTVDSPAIRNLSDFEAYEKIGTYLLSQRNQVNNQPMQSQYVPQQQSYQPQQQYMARQQQQVQQRKQGVSPIRSNPSRGPVQFDPLTCTDEEFSKINIYDLMKG